MDPEDVYESAWFQVKVREVLCTVVMMQDALEIAAALGEAISRASCIMTTVHRTSRSLQR